MKNLLDDLNEYDLNRQGENIEYRAQGNIMTIKYSQPTVQEYRYFDVKWFCPIFFKWISLDLFIKCLFGVMLEKTIIFISKDMQKWSWAVLALRALVQPFKICFTMIPVLPQPVIDYLSAPVPLLIGVSSLLLENNNINYHESASDVGEETNWVHLDDERLSLWNSGDFPIPHLSGLRERIAKHYEFIRKHNKNLLEYQNDDIDYKVQLITDNIRETIFEYFIRQLPLGIKDVYEVNCYLWAYRKQNLTQLRENQNYQNLLFLKTQVSVLIVDLELI